MKIDTSRIEFPCRNIGITGATGTVAGMLIPVLLEQFPQVERITASCRNPDSPKAKRLPDDPRLNLVAGSITDPDVLRRVADGNEVVFHLAAWLANLQFPGITEVFTVNCLANGAMAEMCQRGNARMVFTSSHSVYFAGDYKGRIREDDFVFRPDFTDWIAAVKPKYAEAIDRVVAGKCGKDEVHAAVENIHKDLPPPADPLIYDRDDYHFYCLTKLLAEELALDRGATVLRLSNVYGPGDESTQAVGEACQRLLKAQPGDHLDIHQPFKKLVPIYMGDILTCLLNGAGRKFPADVKPLFTASSQEGYLREDALLGAVANALNEIRGTDHTYDIEPLEPDDGTAFSYDTSKMKKWLLADGEPTPFEEGVKEQLEWLMKKG